MIFNENSFSYDKSEPPADEQEFSFDECNGDRNEEDFEPL